MIFLLENNTLFPFNLKIEKKYLHENEEYKDIYLQWNKKIFF